MDQHQALRAQVGQPQLVHPSSQNKLSQTIEKAFLLPGRVTRRTPVQLHAPQLPLEPRSTGLEGSIKAPTPPSPGEWGQLRGHRQLGSAQGWQLGHEVAKQRFTASTQAPRSIRIRGVDQVEPRAEGLSKRGAKSSVVPLGVISPNRLVAPGPGAETDAVQRGDAASSHDRCRPVPLRDDRIPHTGTCDIDRSGRGGIDRRRRTHPLQPLPQNRQQRHSLPGHVRRR